MINNDKEQLAAELKGSFIEFCRFFFKVVTGKDFIVSVPICRESHHVTIAKALVRAQRLEIESQRLIINVPPGHSKSVMVSLWVAWCYTHNPDCNFLYVSYSKVIASKHTSFIRQVMTSSQYQYLFDVYISHDTKAKDLFRTTAGGTVGAFGASSSITGQDAGMPLPEDKIRFTGAVIIDDAHKPDEAASDSMRQAVIDNYMATLMQRVRSDKVPFIFIGQRVHEDDLANHLIEGMDGYEWQQVVLKSIDDVGNTLYPEAFPKELLLKQQEHNSYIFSAQFQQAPVPAGGALYKPEWFALLEHEPTYILTFITADTAETTSSFNDATVFSFWGLYEIESFGKPTGQMGLQWIDCAEMRIEPQHLEGAFIDFYSNCMLHKTPPMLAAIEKKSTGVTLVSVLKNLRGITIREVERTRASGSKSDRFISIQSYISSKQISFLEGAKHIDMCIEHLSKITANDTHRFDDIADTLVDAIRLAFIEKSLYSLSHRDNATTDIVKNLNNKFNRRLYAGMIRNDPNSHKAYR